MTRLKALLSQFKKIDSVTPTLSGASHCSCMGQYLAVMRPSQTWQEILAAPLDRVPVSVAKLPEDLRVVLAASLPQDEVALRAAGFQEWCDYPGCPGHRYFEGYYHALPGIECNRPAASIHPRLGSDMMRPPAPPMLAAFSEAFRRVNEAELKKLMMALARCQEAAPLAEVLKRGAHFADLSVQVHWGDAVPAEHAAWHYDAANSFLHLALSLQGRRALHAHRGPASVRDKSSEIFWQEERDLYVSAPCSFVHAVEYPQADWDGRVVAVQCRLLLSADELFGAGRPIDTDRRGRTAAAVFRFLAQGVPIVPGLDEVNEVLAEMQVCKQ
eukprot:gnl/TRDRNA2_/TRDRNA2_183945_c0_seq1.p1 gnl/TRDRNA2_/TRDRNA2_183945_c0~~gnl/TRDRNA2_/TRDRNA2_183945_c0_seq1.p1  ORF type:complete len:328 (+),score=49.17 gnl/TRDRNA2_/TRDRNA2_183945_c0_seq1:18-1001(+)